MIQVSFRTSSARVPAPRTPRVEAPQEKGFATAQPWQCKPWLDAQTLGLELRWTEEYTLVVTNNDGQINCRRDYVGGRREDSPQDIQLFAAGHFGVSSLHHIQCPTGFNLLILPHPRSHDPMPPRSYNDTPAVIPGVLESDWWPSIFFIVCHLPKSGQETVFYAGQPFCQVVPVVRGEVIVEEMDAATATEWAGHEAFISQRKKGISTHVWTATNGNWFGNIYKVLAREIKTMGWPGVRAKYAHLPVDQ